MTGHSGSNRTRNARPALLFAMHGEERLERLWTEQLRNLLLVRFSRLARSTLAIPLHPHALYECFDALELLLIHIDHVCSPEHPRPGVGARRGSELQRRRIKVGREGGHGAINDVLTGHEGVPLRWPADELHCLELDAEFGREWQHCPPRVVEAGAAENDGCAARPFEAGGVF